MRPWAQWTAKTALLAVGFAAAAGGLPGVVGAACQVGTAVLPPAAPGQTGPGTANTAPAGGGRSPASPCGSAAAVRGFPRIPLPGEAAHEPVTNRACVPAGIHALLAWLLLCRLRMCGLGV
jgi:hypothetical protein